MRHQTVPCIERHGGTVVKYIGDDVVATFDGPDQALSASTEMIEPTFGDDPDHPFAAFELSIGVGYGPVLHVPGCDLWGDQMNRAFKLGEDTASPGEIMLTDEVWQALESPPTGARRHAYHVSGLDLVAHVITA